MNAFFRLMLLVALAVAAGCGTVSSVSTPVEAVASQAVVISPDRVGCCSWSWRLPMKEVTAQMDKAGVKGVHLALGPFIAPDGRHGAAEGADALAFVKAKVAKGEWKLMSTMIATVGEDYTSLETIRKTGGIVPDKNWAANKRIVTRGAQLTQELGCKFMSTMIATVGEDYTSLETIRKTGGIVPDRNWEANKRIVTRGAQLTQELGCAYMSTHAGFLDESDPVAYKKYVERVTWMRDECRKYGVTLILESGQETAEDLALFMAKVPGVGINFDPANMILYAKGKPMQALKVLYPWIRQVHVKDACETKVPGTWGAEVAWGEGEVGGKAFLAALEALGYKGNYVVEREAGDDRPRDIALAVGRLVK